MASTHVMQSWFDKLTRLICLTDDDLTALENLAFTVEHTSANEYLVREGETASRCCLLLDGYVARNRIGQHARRQIVSFHAPSEMLDLQYLLLPRADNSLQTLTPARVAWVSISALVDVATEFRRVAAAFAKEALIDASISREWVVNIGARDAKARVAHLICEFVQRRVLLGVAPASAVELPFTQEQIGDATGLTSVHVNRMMRDLVREGAFARTGRRLRISDWQKLKIVADFDPAYLHQAA